ncbi:MAG: HAD-IA family hydrolase [Clostridia bacterium]|nr:HAD-IA family hydrolase [Clostridia bacterium]
MSCIENQAVIFDLDGTLLNTLSDLAEAVNYAMEQKGWQARTADEVKAFIGDGIVKLIQRSAPEDAAQNDIDDALQIFTGYYSAHMSDNTVPYDGITAVLQCLKSHGIKTAVVSNKHDSAVKHLISSNFGSLVDYTQGKAEGIAAKPDPSSLLTAAEKTGTDIKNVLYVGDSDVDVLTARNAGCKCAGVTWGYRDEALLKDAGADYIAHSADELLKIIKKVKKF